MADFNVQVFDDIITGTSSTWYSPASFNDQLGMAELLSIHAFSTMVSGTSPTLSCALEHSGDSRNWVPAQLLPEIDAVALTNNTSYLGTTILTSVVFLGQVRVRVTLGGTNPQCRLKLYVKGILSKASAA